MGLWEGGRVLDRTSLVKRPVWAFLQTRDRHIEMSSPANRSLEAFLKKNGLTPLTSHTLPVVCSVHMSSKEKEAAWSFFSSLVLMNGTILMHKKVSVCVGL